MIFLTTSFCSFWGEKRGDRRIEVYPVCNAVKELNKSHEAFLFPCLIIMINDSATEHFPAIFGQEKIRNSDQKFPICEDLKPLPGAHTSAQNTGRENK